MSNVLQCMSCKKYCYNKDRRGTCEVCYVEVRETAVELKREVEELKAKIAFLQLSSPSWHDDPTQYDPRSSPLLSDVVLVASDTLVPIPANKVVLASRSPVFKAMFENDMKEKISGMIKISDVTCDSLCLFVNYLYTAEVCLDEQIACDLLVLAEKYQVKHLKEHCEKYLVSTLSLDNSYSNYVFALQYGAEKLLEASLSIITDNMDTFMNTDEYLELVKKDASLVAGIKEAHMTKQVNIAAKTICDISKFRG
ncbi:hypothetical protein Dimus_024208 [Dionaea muscipula]